MHHVIKTIRFSAAVLCAFSMSGCAMLGMGGEEGSASAAPAGSGTQGAAQTANAVAAGAAVATAAGAIGGGTMAKIQEAADLINKVNALNSMGKAPAALAEPAPNTLGKYLLAFKKDGGLTPWAGKAIEAAASATASSMATDKAAGALAAKVPFLSMFASSATDMAKDVAQGQAAAAAIGGWEKIKAGSDRSFATAEELAVYLHTKYGTNKDYPKALAATLALYPDVKTVYESANRAARGI